MAKYYNNPADLQKGINAEPFFNIPFVQAPGADIFRRRANRLEQLAQAEVSDWSKYLLFTATISRAQQTLLDALGAEEFDFKLPEFFYAQQPHNDAGQMQQSDKETEQTQYILNINILKQNLNPHWNPIADLKPEQSPLSRVLHRLHELLSNDLSVTSQTVWQSLLTMTDTECLELYTKTILQEGRLTKQLLGFWGHVLLQVVWTYCAQQLKMSLIKPTRDRSYCPCCGADAVASLVMNKSDLAGVRYLQCQLCNSLWHALRAKCTFCEDDKSLSLISVDKGEGILVGATGECCGACHGYRKMFLLEKQQFAEPVADDLASLALDIMLAQEDYERGGTNPYLMLEQSSLH